MGTIFLFTALYGFLWLGSLIMLISKDKIMNRIFQIVHSFYFVLFSFIYYDIGDFLLPFHWLALLQLAVAFFFTYRFIKSRVADAEDDPHIPFEQQLTPEIRKNIEQFRKTINSVFNIQSQQNNQEL